MPALSVHIPLSYHSFLHNIMLSSSIYILPSYPCPNFWPDLGHLSHIPFVYQSSVSLHLFFTIIHLLLYDRFHTKSSTNYKQYHV